MSDLLDISILIDYQDVYWKGFFITLKASVFALILSFILGVIIAVFRISTVKPLRWFGTAYVEYIRNIPLLILVFVFYNGLPSIGVNLDSFMAGGLGLGIYTSAFIAEAIRAGIQSVPKGHVEAARSSGLTYLQTMRFVVLPQAIKIVLPPLGNQFINLVKNSSIFGVIAGGDLMYQADIINSETFQTVSVYLFVALFYLLLTIPLSLFVNYLERRLARAY